MSEKRVFVKKLDDQGKIGLKNKFLNQLKQAFGKNINPNEIIEVEDSTKYSLLWSDGVRIYSINRFNKEVIHDGMYSFQEKECIKKFFARFAGALLGIKVDLKDVLDEDTSDLYKVRLMQDGNEVFSMLYEKKQINS